MAEVQSLRQQDTQINDSGAAPPAENVTAAKRQRRPSVRLGEIGDEPAATVTLFHESRRRPRHWKDLAGKSSRTQQSAKFGAGSHHHYQETLDFVDDDNLAIGSWRTKNFKSKRAAKKPRTNWFPKIGEGGGGNGEEDKKFGTVDEVGDGDDDADDRSDGDFEPSRQQSQANSTENLGVDDGRGGSQLRRSHSNSRVRFGDDENKLDGPLGTDGNGGTGNSGRVWRSDGVKNWLNGLGLGKYWPVMEIHEVDEEVLPWLTLEDLKDMGISAVGSRRKMFCAIQMLSKGFS